MGFGASKINIVIESNGIPDHKSPYFETTSDQYEAYNGNNPYFYLNPNRIQEQDMALGIPLRPAEDQGGSAILLPAPWLWR